MSTFGGISTAYSGLVAARTAIDVAGQNIANASTEGYTRQRVTLASTSPLNRIGLFASPTTGAGQGVSVTGIARLANEFLDARVRSTASTAGYSFVRASALSDLEAGLNEPGNNGISASLQDFWDSWQDLSNNAGTGNAAAAAVVLQQGTALATQITQGYNDVVSQWQSLRSGAEVSVSDLNSAAKQVAQLNGVIRSTLNSGGSVNELLDQRAKLTATIASLAGGTVTQRADGTVDVLIGGNPIVSGTTVNEVTVTGKNMGDAVQLEWKHRTGNIPLDGGELQGTFSLLAPTVGTPDAATGRLADAAGQYDLLALKLRDTVNGIYLTAKDSLGTVNTGPFFAGTGASTLSVVPTTADAIVGVGGTAIAGSISQIGMSNGSPDTLWSEFVTDVAVATKGELKQSVLADLAATSASSSQLANASVDLDEENVNLLMAQTAYQAAARVLTAVDEMLDTLINKTGLVGR